LQQQYAASNQQRDNRNHRQIVQPEELDDDGIYGDEGGGIVIIDDDANPGLRGGGHFRDSTEEAAATLDAAASSFTPGTLWSASHIRSRYGHAATVQAQNFPALPTASAPPPSTTSAPVAGGGGDVSSKKGSSRSLQRITKVVAKTDPREVQRQREAREMFVKRAMMSNLKFGETAPPLAENLPPGLPATITAGANDDGPTEGQLLRNQALASALGVAPSTVRASYNSGWARPTTTQVELDEFGNELNSSQYPDSLILEARERLTYVLKLEKKWKNFLADDTAASLPLNSMDRPLRTFVHGYSDYWKLHTESFDPEPKRYIHCVKLRDTRAPFPLLSEAARNWRGPTNVTNTTEVAVSKQPAGQEPREGEPEQQVTRREMPPPPDRQPLPLKPRSLPLPPPGALFDMTEVAESVPAKPDTETDAQINSRSDSLFSGRERPKLALAPRTKPLELPPFEPAKTYNMVEERERQELARQERIQKERAEEDKKRRLLESAFASSDEEESLASYDSDDWADEEEEALFSGDSEEE